MSEPTPFRTLLSATGLPISEERITENAQTYSGLLALISAVRDYDYGETVPASPYRTSWA